MLEQFIAQRVFDIARNANDQHSCKKPEHPLQNGQADNERRVVSEFLTSDGLLETVDGVFPRDPRSGQKEDIGADNAQKA